MYLSQYYLKGFCQKAEILESLGGKLFYILPRDDHFHFLSFPGTRDMLRAYSDMREANYKNSDKYFHARGNYDAAQRGPGGAWAARVIR